MNDEASKRPFYRHLGFDVKDGAPAGESHIELRTRDEITNSRGDMHGGAIAGLLDAAVSVAVRNASGGQEIATVSLTVNYTGPGRGTLVARGRTLRLGRGIASAEASVTDADGALVAHAVATIRIFAPRG